MKAPTDRHTPDDERAARAIVDDANPGASTLAIASEAERFLRGIAANSKPGAAVNVLRQNREVLISARMQELLRGNVMGLNTRKVARAQALEDVAAQHPALFCDMLPPPSVRRSAERSEEVEHSTQRAASIANRASRMSELYAAEIGTNANATQDATHIVTDAIMAKGELGVSAAKISRAITARTTLTREAADRLAATVFRTDPRKRIAVLASALTKAGVR